MRKQSIPGHLSTSMRPGYEANPIGYSQLIVRSYIYIENSLRDQLLNRIGKSAITTGDQPYVCVRSFIHSYLYYQNQLTSIILVYAYDCLSVLVCTKL